MYIFRYLNSSLLTMSFMSFMLLLIIGSCQSENEPATSIAAVSDSQQKLLDASNHFLNTLDFERKEKVLLPFGDNERYNFNFIPMERRGLSLKDMNGQQRIAIHNLLQVALSSQGYLKVSGIMHLEDILHILENGELDIDRDPELYYITFFGDPSVDEPWGWRFEGHHISLNFTSVPNELFATTPAFLGSNPAEVRSGPYTGLRVLAQEEDLGRALVNSLSNDQLSKAIIMEEAPRDIITGTDRNAILEQKEGLPASDMTDLQREMLWQIVEEYANNLKSTMANAQLEKILNAGFDQLHFGWAGGLEKNEPHYYRIHGPTVLFEYDNVQNNANHVHTVWRDLENDFGEDLLRMHYESAPESHGHSH